MADYLICLFSYMFGLYYPFVLVAHRKTEMRDSERDRFSYNAYYNILSNVYDKIAFKVYYKILSSVYYKVLSDALYVFYKTTATLIKKCRSNK